MSGFLCSMVGASFTVAATGQVLRAKKTITAVGNAQVDTAQSQFGGASALFDGTGDYLTVSTGADLTDLTVELWYRAATLPGSGLVPLINFNNTLMYIGYNGANTVYDYFANGSGRVSLNTVAISTGVWYHVAFVRSGSSITVYHNGTSVTTGTFGTAVDYGTYGAEIAKYSSYFFNGHMDEIRVSNTARYTTTFTPSTTPFIDDSNTLLLIHANGTDASTVFEDDNGIGRSQNNFRFIGNAQVSTARSKFGGSSAYFDGSGDYAISANSITFADNQDFTWEFWVNEDVSQNCKYIGGEIQNDIFIGHDGNAFSNRLGVGVVSVGWYIDFGETLALDTWYHLCVQRSGDTVYGYINGVLKVTHTGTLANWDWHWRKVVLGAETTGNTPFNGYLDEMRWSNIVRYATAGFTQPTAPFVNDANTVLLVHADGTNASTVLTDDNAQLTVTPAATSVDEGSSLTFNVSTIDTSDQTLYYTATNSGDFATSSGSFSLASNAGSFSLTPTADTTTEGAETFTASVRIGSTSGDIIATTPSITINDTSVATASAFTDDANTVLLAHFNGSNNSTSFTDDNSSGRTAKTIGFDPANAYTGGVISTAQSKYGGSSLYLSQSGNNMFVQVPVAQNADFGFTGDFTIEAYVYQTDSSGFRTFISNWENAWLLAISGGTAIQFYALGALNINATGLTITSNTWHHIAVTRSGSTTKIWFNGTQVGSSGTLSGTLTVNDATGIGVNINNNPSTNPNSFFQGYIDEIRVSNICRYTATFTPGL